MSKQAPLPVPELPEGVHPTGMPLWKQPPDNFTDVFRTAVKNESTSAGKPKAKVATMRLYGPIYNGWMGVSADAVAKALAQIGDDVEEIRVRINSPGGDVSEAMTILNMLRAHKARTVGVVDGAAFSAGSFLAAGLDETVMSPGTQMMVHDAAGLCFGQAKDMRKSAEALDSFSNSIAAIYAEVAGGDTEQWRAVMLEETWYTADEAVEANLADRVGVVKDDGQIEDAETDDDDLDSDFEDMVRARYDLSIFNYAGRDAAPAPQLPTASAGGSTHTQGGPAVAFSDEQLTKMRAKLELPETADEAAILAAVEAVVDDSLDEPPADTPPAGGAPDGGQGDPAPVTPASLPPGTMVIDSSAWQAQQQRLQRLENEAAKRRREERDDVIAQAVRDGKFAKSSEQHYAKLWDSNPEGTRALIDTLTKGLIPTDELGHGSADEFEADELAHHYPPKGA